MTQTQIVERRAQVDASEKERRKGQELRASESVDRRIEGFAALFNQHTVVGWFVEVIDPGAFLTADITRCACLKNHDESLILGRVSNGTLMLETREQGYWYQCDVAETGIGNDALAEIRRGDLHESSFGFTIRRAVWEEVDRSTFVGVIAEKDLDNISHGGKVNIRRIMEIGTLWDVSPVTWAQYQGTTVEVLRDLETEAENRNDGTMAINVLDFYLKVNEATLICH